jgi:hypothetical protein
MSGAVPLLSLYAIIAWTVKNLPFFYTDLIEEQLEAVYGG